MKSVNASRYFSHVYGRYQAFTLRERVLVTLAMLAVTWMAWNATLGGFLSTAHERTSRSVDGIYSRIEAAAAERSKLQAAKASDPNQRLSRERDRLSEELWRLNESIGTVLERFVEPEHMPALLEDVIRHHKGLTLKRMESLPVEPMELSGGPGSQTEQPVRIYRHPLRLRFEGRYFDVMAYLAELEQGPWEFGWRQLDYQVNDYPVATVTLEIETLSREKNWIGV